MKVNSFLKLNVGIDNFLADNNVFKEPYVKEVRGNQKKISPKTAVSDTSKEVAVVENAGQYELARTVFGKDKVRKVK